MSNETGTQRKKEEQRFNVSRQAIKMLIEGHATAAQICTYLTLARFTDATGKFSTAGLKAVYAATGLSNNRGGVAERAVLELLKDGHLTETTGFAFDGGIIPKIAHGMHHVRHILTHANAEDAVWFPVTLVDGYGRFTQPLRRLKQIGEVATRLLLLLHSNHSPVEFGAVPPRGNMYREYKTACVGTVYDFSFWQATSSAHQVYNSLSLPSLGIKAFHATDKIKKEQLQPLWDAITSLESRGFIRERLVVLDREPGDKDATVVFHLHTIQRHGAKSHNPALATEMEPVMAAITGSGCADTLGRFSGMFPVITRAGIRPVVAGLYQPRFLLTQNVDAREGYRREQQDIQDTAEDLLYLSQAAKITPSDTLNMLANGGCHA